MPAAEVPDKIRAALDAMKHLPGSVDVNAVLDENQRLRAFVAAVREASGRHVGDALADAIHDAIAVLDGGE